MGQAFLGSQGDPWDAQKDMALASLGALLAMLVVALVQRLRGPIPLVVSEPLGEVALRRASSESR